MASFDRFLIGVHLGLLFAVAKGSFVEVVCDSQHMGQVNHQTMLNCEVKPKQDIPDLQISVVVWKKGNMDSRHLIAVYDSRNEIGNQFKEEPRYKFANHNINNRNVSLLISNTEVMDEGEYTCYVVTSSGTSNAQTSLKVTAKYRAPTARSVDQDKDPNVTKILICEATGGYPQGKLRWFDDNKTEWTKSSTQTVNKTENGLLNLYSKLPLLKGSTFEKYNCVVYNSSGGIEESTSITLKFTGPESKPLKPMSAIVAPVVVIGSLIVGLLMALLFFKRRSQREHHSVPASAPEAEIYEDKPPPYEPIDSLA